MNEKMNFNYVVVKEICNGSAFDERELKKRQEIQWYEGFANAVCRAAVSVPDPDEEEPRWNETECEEDYYSYAVYELTNGQPDYNGKPVYRTAYFWMPYETENEEPQDIFEMIDQYNFTFDELERIRLMQEDEELTDEELFDTIIEIARENGLNEDKF